MRPLAHCWPIMQIKTRATNPITLITQINPESCEKVTLAVSLSAARILLKASLQRNRECFKARKPFGVPHVIEDDSNAQSV